VSVRDNLLKLREVLPARVELVAVSKTHPPELIEEAYRAGQRLFGENRPQEMHAKWETLPRDIRWHQIGHLQTNKVRLIAPFVEMIHSVDSARLARVIDREAARAGRVIDLLLEIHIAAEESKEGWQWDELVEWLKAGEWREFANVRFRGVMGVATFTDNGSLVREEFDGLARRHAELKERFFGASFDVISMGMSDDWRLAVECGSTMVRIGSLVFGKREYKKL
jgi:pyridoxal phosphate enzyme (YggS family)